jgi:hypothetical protein
VSNIISRATLGDGVNLKFKNRFTDFEVKLQTKGPADFISQQVTLAPGGTSGWHSHSGPALVSSGIRNGDFPPDRRSELRPHRGPRRHGLRRAG